MMWLLYIVLGIIAILIFELYLAWQPFKRFFEYMNAYMYDREV